MNIDPNLPVGILLFERGVEDPQKEKETRQCDQVAAIDLEIMWPANRSRFD